MIIVHIIKSFAARRLVFARPLTKAGPNVNRIIAQVGWKTEMTTTAGKSKYTRQNALFTLQNSSQRSGNPFKVLLVLSQLSELLKKLMPMNRVDACHDHSFNDLQNSLSILKPFNSEYLNFNGKAMLKIAP